MSETDAVTKPACCVRIFALVAQKLRDANHGYDYGDLDPERAFSAAMWTVSNAIEEAIKEAAASGE